MLRLVRKLNKKKKSYTPMRIKRFWIKILQEVQEFIIYCY